LAINKKDRRELNRIRSAIDFQLEFIKGSTDHSNDLIEAKYSTFVSINKDFLCHHFYDKNFQYAKTVVYGDMWHEKVGEFDKNFNFHQTYKVNRINDFLSNASQYLPSKKSLIHISDSKKKCIILRSNHFAHHIWNDLSSLLRVYNANLLDSIDEFLVVGRPLGEIEDIFNFIPESKVYNFSNYSDLESYLKMSPNKFVYPLGDCFITEELINYITHYVSSTIDTNIKDDLLRIKRNYDKVIWVTFKLGSKTLINQVEQLKDLIDNLSKSIPNCYFIISGFSMPVDANQSFKKRCRMFIRKERNEYSELGHFLIQNNIAHLSLIGANLLDSIYYSLGIDYYISHIGTIQHTPGWIANKPGIVHSNSVILNTPDHLRPGFWERENGIKPILINDSIVKDDEVNESSWDSNYRITDLNIFSEQILNDLKLTSKS